MSCAYVCMSMCALPEHAAQEELRQARDQFTGHLERLVREDGPAHAQRDGWGVRVVADLLVPQMLKCFKMIRTRVHFFFECKYMCNGIVRVTSK